MANIILPGSAAVDTRVEIMAPFFGKTLNLTDPDWYTAEIDEVDGSTPGMMKAIIANPKGSRDDVHWSVALNVDGPFKDMQHGLPVATRRRTISVNPLTLQEEIQEALLFVGQITKVRHLIDVDDDAIEVIGMDGRHKLRDVRLFGRYIRDVNGNLFFQQGESTHFNPGGRPNCVFLSTGIPVFSPSPDFGLSDDQQPATVEYARANPGIVCNWTLGLIIEHLRTFYGPTQPDSVAGVVATAREVFPEIEVWPDWIEWPDGFGSQLDTYAQSTFDAATGQTNTTKGGARKGRDINLGFRPFAGKPGDPGVFDLIFEAAGGWSWTMDYLELPANGSTPASYKNILRAVPIRWGAVTQSMDMPYACGGNQADVKVPVIARGTYGESSEFTYTRAVGLGAFIKIETRCSMDSSDHGSGTPALVKAWSDADYDAMITLAVSLGGGTANDETFLEAASRYWWVLTTYALNPEYNIHQGTQFENYTRPNGSVETFPRAAVPRPVWPFLLSFQGSTLTSRDILPYPIRAEVYNGSSWVLGPEFNGLEVWDNGILYMPAMRDCVLSGKAGSWRWNADAFNVVGGKLNISVNNVRMTLAIPCDHRLKHVIRVVNDLTADSPTWTLMDESPDVKKIAPNFSRQLTVDLRTLYEAWLRYNAWPEPQTSGGTMFSNKTSLAGDGSAALRTDELLLQSHIARDLLHNNRLQREGVLIFDGSLIAAYPVGTQVRRFVPIGDANKKPFDANCVIRRRRFVSERTLDENSALIHKNCVEHYPG